MYLPELFRLQPVELFGKEEIKKAFFRQLEHEFQKAGMNVTFEKCEYAELLQKIKQLLSELPADSVQRLLYVVDIPENLIRKKEQLSSEQEPGQYLADLIIRRVLLKIYLRYGTKK